MMAQFDGDFVRHSKRTHRHASVPRNVFDERRLHALSQHVDAFATEYTKYATGVETTTIVDHDGCFANLLNVIQRLGGCDIRGFLAENDFNQRHFVDRREKVNANKLLGPFGRLCKSRDRQGRRIRSEDRIIGHDGLCFRRNVRLDCSIFEHSLDDQLAIPQVFIVCRGMNAFEQHAGFLGGHSTLLYALLQQIPGVVLALVRLFLRGVEQHNLHPCPGRHKCHAGAHHARTENSELGHDTLFRSTRTTHQLVGGALVNEKCARHITRDRIHEHRHEILRFHIECRVHRQYGSLINRRHDRNRCRVIVVRHFLQE